MNNTKNFFISILIIILMPVKSFGLIEVDITRGNLNPLPLAVSPLSIDEKSRKNFKGLLKQVISYNYLFIYILGTEHFFP